jgi:hypothetical protein
VDPTIDFDCQPPLDAAEVQDEGADRMLPTELQPIQAAPAQCVPQAVLSLGLTPAKLARSGNIVAVCALSHIEASLPTKTDAR